MNGPHAVRRLIPVLLIQFAGMVLLTACSLVGRSSIDVARLGSAEHIQAYECGKPAFDRAIAARSADERTIADWLRTHPDGWRTSIVSYMPNQRIIGSNFNLNFGNRLCVLNYRVDDKGRWTQVEREIAADDPILDLFRSRKPEPCPSS